MRQGLIAGAAVAMLVWSATAASAGSSGEAACAEYFARTSSDSLFLTTPPPEPVAATPIVKFVKGKGKKKRRVVVVPPPQRPKFVDVQVGCVAGSGDGDVPDGLTVSATSAGETLIPEILSTGQPAGRCDPGPLGQMTAEGSGGTTGLVKLQTTCNYRSFGSKEQGSCTKCYQVRVHFQKAPQEQ